MSAAISSLLGALVGGLAAIGGAWLQARNTARLQREEAQEVRGKAAQALSRKALVNLIGTALDYGSSHGSDRAAKGAAFRAAYANASIILSQEMLQKIIDYYWAVEFFAKESEKGESEEKEQSSSKALQKQTALIRSARARPGEFGLPDYLRDEPDRPEIWE